MGDKMRRIAFRKLLQGMREEYKQTGTLFGIPKEKFYRKSAPTADAEEGRLFGQRLDTPIGPAAGPNTQLAQNIVASYLCGGRFIELKTVQILDALEFPKPCIRAEDECYNTEWSTELTIEGAFEEYVKAWFLLHVVEKEWLQDPSTPQTEDIGFLFNMSVGYDLKGIQSEKVDAFIEGLKNAAKTSIFAECQRVLGEERAHFTRLDEEMIASISPEICQSITLSTMHGCPPAEIENICQYLIAEKNLHTFVKMNPTLLGYQRVKETLGSMGYDYIVLKEESFTHDLQYEDGAAMLKRLHDFAAEKGREFGVKLSNTLPVQIRAGELPGEEMYMSGKALYALTIQLALQLAREFAGVLKISYSGGADALNAAEIYAAGIQPITVATTLLKPGGYYRFKQLAEGLTKLPAQKMGQIHLERLEKLAEQALKSPFYRKSRRGSTTRKIPHSLAIWDCYTAPCRHGCPISQDIPRYIQLVQEQRYTEAMEVITQRNPLPFITGTICSHPCMTHCTRLDYEQPVHIRQEKLAAAVQGYASWMEAQQAFEPKTEKKAAVVGAGPSGLTAAYVLAQAGMPVTVFDREVKVGGTVAHVIPDFRIGREAIAKDVALVEKAGVAFQLGVGKDFSLQDLRQQGYSYIYLALGAQATPKAPFPADGEVVLGAVDFLRRYNSDKEACQLGRRVAVIGGGNTAMDTARAALRLPEVEMAAVVYRRNRLYMPADLEEIEQALLEGIVLKEGLQPVSFQKGTLRCEVMTLGEPGADGRRVPVSTGRYEEFPVDTVLLAIGEQADTEPLIRNGLTLDEQGRLLVNDQTNETSMEGVFAGGDLLTGPSTVVEAMAHGRKAAEAILGREGLLSITHAEADEEQTVERDQILYRKGWLAAASADPSEEAARCLQCHTWCDICVEVCPNRANIRVLDQIVHLDGMCNECGNCAILCPYQGAPYLDKLTVFWDEEDYAASENQGLLLLAKVENPLFKLRFAGSDREISLTEEENKDPSLDPQLLSVLWELYKKKSYVLSNQ